MKTLVSIFMIAAMVVVFCAGDTGAAGGEDVVLAMPFDEGEGETTMDISAYGNHGTLKENASWGAGKFGNGVQCEPVGYVDAGKDASLSLSGTDFTLAVWVNMTDTVGHQHGFMAQDEGGGPHNKWILRYNRGASQSVNFHINTADGGGSMQLEPGLWDVQPNSWHQVAVVRAGNTYTFYTDGEQAAQLEDALPVPEVIDAPVTVGWAEGPIAMSGLIDEALIAKRAFTADEIRMHFDGGVQQLLTSVQPEGKSASVWGGIKANILR